MSQIRLQRTTEIDQVLIFLQKRYPLLSDAEIIKVALSEIYKKEQEEKPSEYLKRMIRQGRKDYKAGKASPGFDNAKDAIAYLDKQGI